MFEEEHFVSLFLSISEASTANACHCFFFLSEELQCSSSFIPYIKKNRNTSHIEKPLKSLMETSAISVHKENNSQSLASNTCFLFLYFPVSCLSADDMTTLCS